LGRKGKCPACGNPFVLEEAIEEEVQLELAAPEEAAVGTSAKWVPDDAPILSDSPTQSPKGRTAAPTIKSAPAPPVIQTGADDGGMQRLQELKARGKKGRNKAILIGGFVGLCIGGVILAVAMNGGDTGPSTTGNDPNATTSNSGGTQAVGTDPNAMMVATSGGGMAIQPGQTPGSVIIPHHTLTPSQLTINETWQNDVLPSGDKPIQTNMIPNGVNVLIHLQPAKLWSDDPAMEDLRYSLTEEVVAWIGEKLKEICHREPQQIKEVLIGIRLGATGTDPEIATVFHLVEEAKRSDLIEEFKGAPYEEGVPPSVRMTLADGNVYAIKDTDTIAIAPQTDAYMIASTVQFPNADLPGSIYDLIQLSGESRLFTVIFSLDDVKRHEEWLFAEPGRETFRRILDWFGDDVESVLWSVGNDPEENAVFSDLILRTRAAAHTSALAKDTLIRLERLPPDLVAAAEKMYPQRQGSLDMIGRFPAMMEVFREATVPAKDSRNVRMVTYLPQKAGPNLALGTLLTWHESLRTDFSASTQTPTVAMNDPQSTLPETAMGRLQIEMDCEFNNPFQNAIDYVAEETKLTFEIDGNALKDAGFTKNMPQKFNLGRKPAIEALREFAINNRPPTPDKRICFCVDEATMTVLVTTEKFAADQGKEFLKLVDE